MTFDPVAMADMMADTNVRNHEAGHHDLPRKGCAPCEPVRFFFDNAGWGYNIGETPEEGRLRGAKLLAESEAWAKRMGVTFVWENDPDNTSDGDVTPRVRESCIAYLNGEVVASLGSIGDATDEYRRVVEAELALEAMDNHEPEGEAPDMRAHRLANAILDKLNFAAAAGSPTSIYNATREVLIEEFARGEA